MALRYLLDENLDPLFRPGLLRRQPDLVVWSVGEPGAPLLSTLDPDTLIWCESNRCLLITNNRRSMPAHLADHLAAERHVPGILVLRQRADLDIVLNDLILIAEAARDDEYRDRIDYVPLA